MRLKSSAGPQFRPETTAEARVLRWAPAASIVGAVLIGARPGPMLVFAQFDNPLSLPTALGPVLAVAGSLALVVAIAPTAFGVVGMVRRYRAAEAIERLQLRWFAWAASLTLMTLLGYTVLGLLLNQNEPGIREGLFALFVIAATNLPIAILVAISRYQLYDIDAIIGRTVAYGALTAILAGLYAASLRLFNALFVATTGETSETALVLTTLVLATTFTPIKGGLERWAARRFPPESQPGQAPPAASESGGPGSAATLTTEELDARIAAIARRVAREVMAEARERSSPAA